jgi:hypothetical protein
MNRTFAALLSFFLTISIPAPLFAKADTIKITISGTGLRTPIEITDPKILTNFRVWTGPGTSSNEAKGFIVDWSQGPVAERPKTVRRYQVSFYAKLPNERLIYVVFYEYDPSTEPGYIYLPGKSEEFFGLNVSTISHGVEGNWFRAWSVWENVARPLIAKAMIAVPSVHNQEVEVDDGFHLLDPQGRLSGTGFQQT